MFLSRAQLRWAKYGNYPSRVQKQKLFYLSFTVNSLHKIIITKILIIRAVLLDNQPLRIVIKTFKKKSGIFFSDK